MTFQDATIEFWGDRFVAAGLRAVMTFEQFMTLSPPMRERRSQLLLDAEIRMAREIERQFPDAALHDGALIEPFHHGKFQLRKPWFRNDRNHV
jgi:hypothetical protein